MNHVVISTTPRSLHKLYETLSRSESGLFVSLEEDMNLKQLFDMIESVLLRSGYMNEQELRAIRVKKASIDVRSM